MSKQYARTLVFKQRPGERAQSQGLTAGQSQYRQWSSLPGLIKEQGRDRVVRQRAMGRWQRGQHGGKRRMWLGFQVKTSLWILGQVLITSDRPEKGLHQAGNCNHPSRRWVLSTQSPISES